MQLQVVNVMWATLKVLKDCILAKPFSLDFADLASRSIV
jgi:hypothetical protein